MFLSASFVFKFMKFLYNLGASSNVIWSLRRGQSQKPNEIYKYIEKFAPKEKNNTYIELFGRRNNLRNGWVTLGNEL